MNKDEEVELCYLYKEEEDAIYACEAGNLPLEEAWVDYETYGIYGSYLSEYEISSTGDDFIGSASTWREDYV